VRALGIDLGTRRIGVAVSDSAGTMALPYEVVERSGDRSRDHRRIGALVEETGAEVVVVGLPLSLDGSTGPAAAAALEEAEQLRTVLAVPVMEWDERLTTVTAHRELAASGVPGRKQRRVVDQVAASVMLQGWLEHRRAAMTDPREDPGR
jgi:putative holliday junction resolvase